MGTVQILGAEKALFRALKTKHDTPKYGLIYHASMVGQAGAKSKGKISRMLAAKSSLAARYDVLGEDVNTEMGIQNRAKNESRIRFLEEGGMTKISGTGKSASKQQKYEVKSEDISVYNTSMDTTIGKKRKAMDEEEERVDVKVKKVKVEKEEEAAAKVEEEEEKPKKKKKKKEKEAETEEAVAETPVAETVEEAAEVPTEKPKKKKKKKKQSQKLLSQKQLKRQQKYQQKNQRKRRKRS